MTPAAQAIGRPLVAQNVFGQPLTIFGLPVDRETIFKNHKGWYKAGVEKRQRKLIAKTTFVNFFLKPKEQIRCITTGYSPVSAFEQIVTGPAFLFFKKAYFIITNQRILHIPSRIDHLSPSAISQIRYDDCRHLKFKGRSLIVQYKSGNEEIFPYIHRKERQRIKKLLADLPVSAASPAPSQDRVYLCPSCTSELTDSTHTCQHCKLQFKSKTQAKFRSWMIPGGGYFYNRYPIFGFVVGTLEAMLLSAIVFQLSNFTSGGPANFNLIGLLTCLFLIEKIIVAYHARQLSSEYIPEEKNFALRKA